MWAVTLCGINDVVFLCVHTVFILTLAHFQGHVSIVFLYVSPLSIYSACLSSLKKCGAQAKVKNNIRNVFSEFWKSRLYYQTNKYLMEKKGVQDRP